MTKNITEIENKIKELEDLQEKLVDKVYETRTQLEVIKHLKTFLDEIDILSYTNIMADLISLLEEIKLLLS